MPAYLIAKVNVTDPEQYKAYTLLTPAIVAEFGGRFVVRGGEKITLEGTPDSDRIVLVEFPDLATAQAFYESEAYQAAKAVRENAASASFIVVDGV